MPTGTPHPPGFGQPGQPPRAVLIRSPAPPELPAIECIDIRPGAAATFDGDRVQLSLSVRAEDHRRCIGWRDFAALETALTRVLPLESAAVVRFGDRSACRAALGPDRVAAVERQLVATVRREGAVLVTWTGAPPRDADYRVYDAVVGPAARAD
jgi:hypothetical protein